MSWRGYADRERPGGWTSPLSALAEFANASHARAIAVLVAASLLAFIPGFFQLPPIDRDEPRYAQATKQMSETGNYIDIRYQDVPRYLQPIGVYWLQAAATKITGYGTKAPIWVHRIPSLLGATAAVALTYWVALPLVGSTGSFIAALFMAASVLLGVEARLAKTDALLLASVLGAMGFLARAYLGRPIAMAAALAFWCALAAGVLIKGPLIGLVIGSTALALCVWERSAAWLGSLRPARGMCVFLLLTLPWFIAIGIASNGEFYSIALGKSLLGKVGTGEQGHGAPPGTYLLAFWVSFWPAAGLALIAAPWAWKNRSEPAIRFCLAWIVPTWLVFELVVTKLPHYVLPLYPAISILIALALLAGRRPGLLLAYGIASGAFALAIGGPAVLYWIEGKFAWAALVVSLAAAALMARGASHAKTAAATPFAMSIAFPAIVVCMATFGLVLPRFDSIRLSPRIVAAVERNTSCPQPTVVSAGFQEASLIFLLGTETRFVWPQEAAAFLASGGCRIALVSDRYEAPFLAAMEQLNRQAMLRERVDGINLGKGRKESIAVYISPPP
jgi:4-amino-4-deoxy-L-arabinose transferase-like glycosyltransferase